MLFSGTNIGVEFFNWREGIFSNLFDFIIYSLSDVFFNIFELIFSSPLLLEDQITNNLYRITSISNLLNFLFGSVCNTWVRHWVTVISICIEFKEKRTILLNVTSSPFHDFTNHKYILSIDMNTRNQITSCVKFIVEWGTFLAGSHTVVIILTNINHWELH